MQLKLHKEDQFKEHDLKKIMKIGKKKIKYMVVI